MGTIRGMVLFLLIRLYISVPCEGYTPLEQDHELVKSSSNASARKIQESAKLSDIKKEYQFLVMHCCRKTYHLQFSRCDQASYGHCCTTPVRADRFLSILQKMVMYCQLPP